MGIWSSFGSTVDFADARWELNTAYGAECGTMYLGGFRLSPQIVCIGPSLNYLPLVLILLQSNHFSYDGYNVILVVVGVHHPSRAPGKGQGDGQVQGLLLCGV